MPTKLIQVSDEVLVEVEPSPGGFEEISFGASLPSEQRIELLKPFLLSLTRPVLDAWRTLQREEGVVEAEMSLAVGFTASGNLYIARTEGTASLQLKIKLHRVDT